MVKTGFWGRYAPYIVTQQKMLVHRAARRLLYGQMRLNKDDVILEAGCGRAPWCEEMALNFRPNKVVGLDFEHEMLAQAEENVGKWQRRLYTPILLVQGNMTSLPFAGGTFSKIVSILGWGYQTAEENQMAMREFARVGEPGAHVGIFTLKKPGGLWRSVRSFYRFIAEEMKLKKGAAKATDDFLDPFIGEKAPGARIVLGAVYYTFVMASKVRSGEWELPATGDELKFMAERAGLETVSIEDAYAGTGLVGVFRVPK